MPKKIPLIEKALLIALSAHEGQVRKDDNSQYVAHPIMVALKLVKHGFSESVIAAALAHDVLEDTSFDKELLRKELGEEVFEIIIAVTEDKNASWEERKRKYILSVREGSESAKAVSVADKIHNLESFLSAYAYKGPALWKKFSRGKEKKVWFDEEMLNMFKETWTHPLVDEYDFLVKELKRSV